MFRVHKQLNWTSNIWVGTTIELEKYAHRSNILSKIPASIRFLSLEPLLGPIKNLPLNKIDWIIVGGESGINARPMNLDWALTIKEMCQENQIKFFFKQFGGRRNKRGGAEALLEGKLWHQYPEYKGRFTCHQKQLYGD